MPEPVQVDRIVRAEWVATMDPQDTVVGDGAVAVRDGRIVAVGGARAILAAHRADEVVHLPGHVVVPGLVNAHTHLAMAMFRGVADDLALDDFLARLIPAEIRVLTEERVATAALAASVECLLSGTTTVLDMYYRHDAALEAASRSGLRLLAGPVFLDPPGADRSATDRELDRAEEWLSAHPARPGWRPTLNPHSTYTVDPRHLERVRDLAAEHDATVHIHAAETVAEVLEVVTVHGCRPVQHLDRLGLLGPSTVLAHAVHLDDGEVERLTETGTSVAHCPASNLKLASGIARVPDLVSRGVDVGIGTDGPASSNDLDMFAAMRLTALLHKGTTGDPRTLPAHRVLRMATLDGAAALGVADAVGSIEAGKLADLVAVDLDRPHTQPVYDPVSTLVYAAGRGDVRHVWVEGEPVISDGRAVRCDEGDVTAGLSELRAAVLAALRG